jgi:hypothetical protein
MSTGVAEGLSVERLLRKIEGIMLLDSSQFSPFKDRYVYPSLVRWRMAGF